MFFTYVQAAVEMKRYYTAGKLISWSRMHGGPGLKALDSTLFTLVCGQADSAGELDWHSLPDGEIIQDKVRQVCIFTPFKQKAFMICEGNGVSFF